MPPMAFLLVQFVLLLTLLGHVTAAGDGDPAVATLGGGGDKTLVWLR